MFLDNTTDPDLPKAGSYGYSVDEEDMFDYDRPMVEQATDDFDLVLRNACRAALKKGLVSDPDDMLVLFFCLSARLLFCMEEAVFISILNLDV